MCKRKLRCMNGKEKSIGVRLTADLTPRERRSLLLVNKRHFGFYAPCQAFRA